jgi:hypothetical protein
MGGCSGPGDHHREDKGGEQVAVASVDLTSPAWLQSLSKMKEKKGEEDRRGLTKGYGPGRRAGLRKRGRERGMGWADAGGLKGEEGRWAAG